MNIDIEYCGSCQYYPVVSKLLGKIIQDYEPDIQSVTLRPFDDGRFIVFKDGKRIFDKEQSGRFPQYDEDIKSQLSPV